MELTSKNSNFLQNKIKSSKKWEKHNHINYICIELLFIPFQVLLVLRNATQFPLIFEILTMKKTIGRNISNEFHQFIIDICVPVPNHREKDKFETIIETKYG